MAVSQDKILQSTPTGRIGNPLDPKLRNLLGSEPSKPWCEVLELLKEKYLGVSSAESMELGLSQPRAHWYAGQALQVGVQGARRTHSRVEIFLLFSFPAHLGPGLSLPFLSDSLIQVSGEEDVVAEPWADPPRPRRLSLNLLSLDLSAWLPHSEAP